MRRRHGNLHCVTTIEYTTVDPIESPDLDPVYHEARAVWEFSPGDPGQLSGPPEACYPPSDPELLAVTITDEHEGDADGFREIDDWIIGKWDPFGEPITLEAEMTYALEQAEPDDPPERERDE